MHIDFDYRSISTTSAHTARLRCPVIGSEQKILPLLLYCTTGVLRCEFHFFLSRSTLSWVRVPSGQRQYIQYEHCLVLLHQNCVITCRLRLLLLSTAPCLMSCCMSRCHVALLILPALCWARIPLDQRLVCSFQIVLFHTTHVHEQDSRGKKGKHLHIGPRLMLTHCPTPKMSLV